MLLNILIGIDFLPVVMVLVIAWITPIVLSMLKIRRFPAVVLEIALGFAAGHFFLHLVSSETLFILDFLAFTGLIFIMFLSGLEIDTDLLTGSFPGKRVRFSHFLLNPLLAGFVHFLLTLAISYAGTLLLANVVEIPNRWFFSVILTTTFLGLVLPVLKSRGETHSHFGQMIIVAAAIADVMGIVLLVFTSVVIHFGFNYELLIVLGLFLVFYIFYHIGKVVNRKFVDKISFQLSHAASQISIRGAMVLLFFFVAISQFIGQEGILLGAFLSGLLLSFFMHRERSLLILKLDGMGYGFFIPVFFVMTGAQFDPSSLGDLNSSPYLFLFLMILLMYLVKIIPSFLWIGIFGFRKVMAGGFLMAARLGLVIAAAFIGVQLGAITPGLNSAFIIMAVFTCIFSPMIYNLIYRQKVYQDDKTVIVGGSSVGVLLARRLKMHGRASVIIEADAGRYHEILEKGIDAILGDGSDPEVYRQIGLTNDNYVLVNAGSDHRNLEICESLRKEFQHERIISVPGTARMEHSMRRLGIEILDSRRILAATIESLILRPTTYHSLVESFENYHVADVRITNSSQDGRVLKEIPLHRDGMVMLLSRGNDKYVPHGETYLKMGDVLTVFGTDTAINQIRDIMDPGFDA